MAQKEESMEEIDTVFKLTGLHCTGIRFGPGEGGEEVTILDCEPTGRRICPICGSKYVYVDRHYIRYVQDLDCAGNKVFLCIHGTRYRCREVNPASPNGICGNTFSVDLVMIDEKSRITKRLRNRIVGMAADRSFLSVAKELDVSDMTVKREVDDYFKEKDEWHRENFYCPVGIGIDENHIANQYCLIITDNDQHTLLDMFKDKDPETVRSVLEKLKEKDNLRYVTMDLCLEYRSCVRDIFGQKVAIIADHFHTQKLITKAMRETAKNLEANASAEARKGTFYNQQLLLKNIENLTEEDKKRMCRMFKAIPGLELAYALKEAFRTIYNYKNRSSAEKAFERFCNEVPEDKEFQPFRKAIKTIRSWHTEVFNYFDFDGASNGFTEAENNIISRRNIIGNGYSFEVLRWFALFGKSSTAFRPNRKLEKSDTAQPDYSHRENQ